MLQAILLALLTALSGPAPTNQTATSEESQALFKANLERRVARHPYLKKIDLEWVWDYEDFVVLVQKPAKMEPGYVEKAAKLRVAASLQMNELFKAGLAKDYGLQLRATSPRQTIVVLATGGDMDNYFMARYKVKSRGRTSLYDVLDRSLTVVQEPYQGAAGRQGDWRLSDRQDRASQLLHAYGARSEVLPGPYWFQRGLSNELSGNNDRERSKKGQGKHSEWAYHRLCAALQDPLERASTLLPLSVILGQTGYRSVGEACKAQAALQKETAPNLWICNQAYGATTGALFHYMTYDAPDPLRARMKSFSEACMKGRLKQEPFEKHFQGVNWAALEEEFWSYIWEHHLAQSPKEELKDEALAAFLKERSGQPKPIVVQGFVVGFQPALLLAHVQSSAARLALALANVCDGQPELAIQRLEAQAQASTGQDKARVEREILRVKAWIAARDGYFAFLVESGKKLILDWEGERLVAQVESVHEDRLVFASCNRGFETLAVSDIDSVVLAQRMLARRADFDPGWGAAYPLVLDPEASAARWLKSEEKQVVALALDEDGDYPARRKDMGVARHIALLAAYTLDGPEATGAGPDASELLEHLSALWALRDEVIYITGMKDTLAACARVLLARKFDSLNYSDLLAGEVKQEGEGYVHVVYEFDKPGQLADWPLDELEAASHERWAARPYLYPSLEVDGGKLVGVGAVSRSHILSLAGPQSITWKMTMVSGGQVSSDKESTCRISVCALPGNQYAGSYNGLELEVRSPTGGDYAFKEPEGGFKNFFDKQYTRELLHDGEGKLSVISNGKPINSLNSNAPLVGHPQVFIHSDYSMVIERIEVWGQLHEGSMDGLRTRWLAAEMGKLGMD